MPCKPCKDPSFPSVHLEFYIPNLDSLFKKGKYLLLLYNSLYLYRYVYRGIYIVSHISFILKAIIDCLSRHDSYVHNMIAYFLKQVIRF